MADAREESSGRIDRLFRAIKQRGRWAVMAGGIILIAVAIGGTLAADPQPVGIADGASRYGGAADVFRSLLWISAATGLIAMALVQVIKYVFNIRGRFHRSELEQYFEHTPGPEETAYSQLKKAINETTWGEHYAQRERPGTLEARGQAHTLYVWSLPLEQLAGQLSAAGEVALMEDAKLRLPQGTPTGEGTAYARDYGLLLARLSGETVPNLDAEVEKARSRPVSPAEGGAGGEDVGEGLTSAELAQRVQRGIDVIQIVIGHRWRWLVRAASIFFCAPIAWVIVSFTDTAGSARLLAVLVATVLGGYLSWFARDLAAAVEARRG